MPFNSKVKYTIFYVMTSNKSKKAKSVPEMVDLFKAGFRGNPKASSEFFRSWRSSGDERKKAIMEPLQQWFQTLPTTEEQALISAYPQIFRFYEP